MLAIVCRSHPKGQALCSQAGLLPVLLKWLRACMVPLGVAVGEPARDRVVQWLAASQCSLPLQQLHGRPQMLCQQSMHTTSLCIVSAAALLSSQLDLPLLLQRMVSCRPP